MRTGGVNSTRRYPSRRSRLRAMRPLFPSWEKRSSSTHQSCAGSWTRPSGRSARLYFARTRQLDAHQEALFVIDELDVTAMAQHDVARDGEAQASAAGFAVARLFEALEGGESPLHLIGRDAGAVVADVDD